MLPPFPTVSAPEPGEDLKLARKKLREARQSNKLAAIVVNAHTEMAEYAAEGFGVDAVPMAVVREMLTGITNALGGETDPARLSPVFPDDATVSDHAREIFHVARVRIRAVLETED